MGRKVEKRRNKNFLLMVIWLQHQLLKLWCKSKCSSSWAHAAYTLTAPCSLRVKSEHLEELTLPGDLLPLACPYLLSNHSPRSTPSNSPQPPSHRDKHPVAPRSFTTAVPSACILFSLFCAWPTCSFLSPPQRGMP